MKNTGKRYEKLVQDIYQRLLDMDGHNIKVRHDIRLKSKIEGIMYQVDVYFEFFVGDIQHRVVIECKDHKSPIKIDVVEAFKSRLDHIGNCTGIIISKNGFQRGAKLFAEANDILLLHGSEEKLSLKLILKGMEKLLPDENTIGQPFWTIMEERNGEITGSYGSYGEERNIIVLFDSKKVAQEFLRIRSDIDCVVRGINQMHLKGILAIAELGMAQVGIMRVESAPKVVLLSPEYIREFYLVC